MPRPSRGLCAPAPDHNLDDAPPPAAVHARHHLAARPPALGHLGQGGGDHHPPVRQAGPAGPRGRAGGALHICHPGSRRPGRHEPIPHAPASRPPAPLLIPVLLSSLGRLAVLLASPLVTRLLGGLGALRPAVPPVDPSADEERRAALLARQQSSRLHPASGRTVSRQIARAAACSSSRRAVSTRGRSGCHQAACLIFGRPHRRPASAGPAWGATSWQGRSCCDQPWAAAGGLLVASALPGWATSGERSRVSPAERLRAGRRSAR